MNNTELINAIVTRCAEAGITPSSLFIRAGRSASNLTHWKNRPELVTVDTLRLIEQQLTRTIQAALALRDTIRDYCNEREEAKACG